MGEGSGETRGEWRDQWGVARVRGKWGELRGEWGVLRQVAREATCSEVVRDLPTSYFPLGSPHSPLTLATSPWSRHPPLTSPLPFSRERAPPAPPPASRSAPGTASTRRNPARSDGRT